MGNRDESKSSLLHNRNNPRKLGYSTFDPGASIDSGVSFSGENKRTPWTVTAVEESRDGVSISWENIDVFVEVPGPSFLKRLCSGNKRNEKPTTKQVLFNGKYMAYLVSLFFFLSKRNFASCSISLVLTLFKSV